MRLTKHIFPAPEKRRWDMEWADPIKLIPPSPFFRGVMLGFCVALPFWFLLLLAAFLMLPE